MQDLYPQRYGYIGFPKKMTESGQISVKNGVDFLDLILRSVDYNSKLGLNILCIDTSEFKDLSFLDSFEFDEENPKVSSLIDKINSIAKKKNFRICFFISKEYFIASNLDGIPEKTSFYLERISLFLDLLGQRGRSILVRIGSAYGNRKATLGIFNERLSALSNNCSKKIVVVNDEKPSLFSITDLISGCYYESQTPVCFRFLSHFFNDGGLNVREAFFLSCSTWKFGSNPIIIHGEPEETDESGFPLTSKTSPYITRRIPTFGLSPDILIDSAEKENACVKYMSDVNKLKPIVINRKK